MGRQHFASKQKWLKKENSLIFLPTECYNIFSYAKSSIVKPIVKWVKKVLYLFVSGAGLSEHLVSRQWMLFTYHKIQVSPGGL